MTVLFVRQYWQSRRKILLHCNLDHYQSDKLKKERGLQSWFLDLVVNRMHSIKFSMRSVIQRMFMSLFNKEGKVNF